MDKYFEFTNTQRKIIGDENDSEFKDYRDINENEKTKYNNDKLSNLTVHDKLKNLDLDNVMMSFDATSLYPSATYDENSV